ncbi:MAG: MBL fold metallo-hydrolase [Phycisphaerales bacterium]
MRFVFLGTGTSSGVPAIGCDCAVCLSTDPRDQRLRTAAAIRWTDGRGTARTLLIDAGPDLRQQALRAKLDRCDAVVFTHNHVDHTFGLDEVRRFNAVMRAPIDVYADAHTMEHLRRVYKHIFDRQANINDSFVATLIAHQIEPARAIEVYGLRLTPIPLLHGKLPVLGYRIEAAEGENPSSATTAPHPPPLPAGEVSLAQRVTEGDAATPALKLLEGAAEGASEAGASSVFPLAYCTDVSGIPPESWGLLRGVKTLVLDALRHRHHPTHFTLGQAVSVAHEIGAERTYFVHMAHDLGHEATNRDLPEGMMLAHDGLELG